MHRGLGRLLHPHARWCNLLSLLYFLLCVDHVAVLPGTKQETVLPVSLQNNADLIDLLWATPPPATVPS